MTLDPVSEEVFNLSTEIKRLTEGMDPYVALGGMMGNLAAQMVNIHGKDALEKFTKEYVDVISALIVRAGNMQQ